MNDTTGYPDGHLARSHLKCDPSNVFERWDDEPRCEVKIDDADTLCMLPARWHWNFHGCSRGIMCTGHVNLWHEEAAQAMLDDPSCSHCGVIFHTLSDACSFRLLG